MAALRTNGPSLLGRNTTRTPVYGGVEIIILIKTRTDGSNGGGGGVGSPKYARIIPSALDLGLPNTAIKNGRDRILRLSRATFYIAVYFGLLSVQAITINTDGSAVKP